MQGCFPAQLLEKCFAGEAVAFHMSGLLGVKVRLELLITKVERKSYMRLRES